MYWEKTAYRSSAKYSLRYELINDFGYEDNEDIQKSGNFVKLPLVDCLDLIKGYIEENNLSSLKSKIQQLTANGNKCFTVAFRIAIEAAGDIEDNRYSYFEKAGEPSELTKDC